MNMTYKGYAARIEYDDDDEIFVGEVAAIRDIIVFDGVDVSSLQAAFAESIDSYLAACKSRGETPNKPYSGNISLRVGEDIHAAVATASHLAHKSINQWATDVLESAAHR